MKDAIRYTVTVKAITERVETSGKEWATLAEKEVAGTSPPRFEKVMGYTPEIDKTVRRELQIFEQTVTELDMAELVKVVNGIKS